MPSYFPRQTIDWREVEEPAVFRRLSLSLLEMALITGVVLRVLRAVTFTTGRASWLVFGASLAVSIIILVGMATAHLANFSLQRWVWRAPAFAALVAVGAMATSLLLIAMHREPEGTARADFRDWPSMALYFLLYSELVVCIWALVLAGVILLIRRSGLRTNVEPEPEGAGEA
jgi:hypothetical protein